MAYIMQIGCRKDNNGMKKRKLLSFILAGCLFFTGCSGGGEEEPETTTDEYTYVTVTDDEGNPVTDSDGSVVTSIVPKEPKEVELVVGFIYPGSVYKDPDKPELGSDDASTEYFEDARQEIKRVLGAKTCYVENVLVGQVEAATAALVQHGCNVIVGASMKYASAIREEATANSKVHFISFGGGAGPGNLSVFQGETYLGSFVCGLAAAYNSDSNILGVVADPAVLSVHSLINGYIEGAKNLIKDDTDVRVNWANGSHDDETKEAIDNLVSQGCDVIFTATYSNFAIEYCELLGVKVIGMSYRTPELAPDNYIMGTFCNLRLFLIDALRSIRYTSAIVGIYEGGVKEGAVRVVAVSEKAKEGTKEITDALYKLCSEGNAVIFEGEMKDSDGNIVIKKGETLDASKIRGIEWLEESVKNQNNYCQPILNPSESDLIIHSDYSNASSEEGTDTAEPEVTEG